MGDSRAFITIQRRAPKKRTIEERVFDWDEITLAHDEPALREQASRCMDCGVPFCHNGCPLGNLIPDWNDLIYRGHWIDALQQLHATNNFPEFTGRLCPAPCEDACVLNINDDPVTIKAVEQAIIDKGFEMGWVGAEPPQARTGKTVAVIGSGPAGLAAAQQLNRAGHTVTVFEKDDRLGGLLRYGIPDFKMGRGVLDRRLALLGEEGIAFRTGVEIGVSLTADELKSGFDAVVLAVGSDRPRDLTVPGRELDGVAFAMEYLTQQNRVVSGDDPTAWPRHLDAREKHVVIIGGGDTGADCYGTAIRQGAKSVTQFQIHAEPSKDRPDLNPWWPHPAMILKTSPAHEEGGLREWGIHTTHLSGEGAVKELHAVRVAGMEKGADGERRVVPVPGSEVVYPADLVLIAIGYDGPRRDGLLHDLGVETDKRGSILADGEYMTSVPGVFTAGDARRGASLIVWAIAEGREAAHFVDKYLMGESRLPLTAYK